MSEPSHLSTSVEIIKIATRGSILALWQAQHVAGLLAKIGRETQIITFKTVGDQVQDRMLHEIGGKGLFVREIETALLEGKAHIGVHSLKDLPVTTPDGVVLSAFLPRHIPLDTLIVGDHMEVPSHWKQTDVLGIADLAACDGWSIGTGSLRRTTLLHEANPRIKVKPIRGNIDTRIAKASPGDCDGIILAQAALDRSGLGADKRRFSLDASWFIPSAAQGVVVIECQEHAEVAKSLAALDCSLTRQAVMIEREVLRRLGGDCTMPVGVFARSTDAGSHWSVAAMVGSQGKNVHVSLSSLTGNVDMIASAVMEQLDLAGVKQALELIRSSPSC